MTEAPVQSGSPDLASLRDQAVDQLVENATITSKAVEAAMRSVPRHLFIPEASPEEAYNPFRAVVTKRDEEGNALSSVSDMHVQAWMLEAARIAPGMNVLEVGSGGYNAALLQELVGPAGRVTTVDCRTLLSFTANRGTLKHALQQIYCTLQQVSGALQACAAAV